MKNDVREVIKKRRISIQLTLRELSGASGVSASHLGRIERRERFPSARVLRKIAVPLGYDVNELMRLADYLPDAEEIEEGAAAYGLDPIVAKTLAQYSTETQYIVLAILLLLKALSGKDRNKKQ